MRVWDRARGIAQQKMLQAAAGAPARGDGREARAFEYHEWMMGPRPGARAHARHPARGARLLAAGAAAMAAIAAAGCSGPQVFSCQNDNQCTLEGVTGRCEDTGYCSLPDGACASGYRYADQAAGELAGECVGGGDGGGDCTGPGCCDGQVCPETGCIAAIASGGEHSCAATSGGDVYCWGANDQMQLGSSGGDSAAPRKVAGVSGAMALAAGDDHTCALLGGGGVVCWGANDAGQLGTGQTGAAALAGSPVSSIGGVKALAAGDRHTCAIDSDDSVYCWGDNGMSQVLDGESAAVSTPVEVTGILECAVAVAAGGLHSAMVLDNGAVLTWGQADAPALGRGSTAFPGPGDITLGGFAAQSVAAGDAHTCGVGQDGQLRCWGVGADGQLGVSGDRTQPAMVPGLAAVDQVSAGGRHTCALSGNQLVCFGANDSGQLGTDAGGGTALEQVAGAWREVAAGRSHTCARDASGRVDCWGANDSGQLGDGSTGGSRSEAREVDVPCP